MTLLTDLNPRTLSDPRTEPNHDTCDGLCESNPCICPDVSEILDECHRMGDGDAITSLAWLSQIDRTTYADGAWDCVHGWLFNMLSAHERGVWERMQGIQREVDKTRTGRMAA